MKLNSQADTSDPRDFLKLPKAERLKLLEQQAKGVIEYYQPGNPHIEWTETYQEDSANEPITQTR
jgi:hypothetical protein